MDAQIAHFKHCTEGMQLSRTYIVVHLSAFQLTSISEVVYSCIHLIVQDQHSLPLYDDLIVHIGDQANLICKKQ